MENASPEQVRYCAQAKAVLAPHVMLFRNPVSGRLVRMDDHTARIASLCSRFATAEQHCARLKALGPAATEDYAVTLHRAIHAGMCVSKDQLYHHLINGLAPLADRRLIDVIGIPTRNRPRLLERALNSLAEHLQEYEREASVIVVDDSDSISMQDANAKVIAAYRHNLAMPVRHINHQIRERFATELARDSGVPRGLVSFALERNRAYPFTTGAARNVILLHTVGHRILCLDDDIQCRLAAIPNSRDSVAFRSEILESWFFASAADIATCQFVRDDILALHEKVLNISRSAISNGGGEALETDIGSVSYDVCERLGRGAARVVASQMGFFGDCGNDDPLSYYLQDPATWSRLVSSEKLYHAATANRLVLRGVRSFLIMAIINSQTGCLGLDNTAGLPPFLPVMRGEDAVFGLLTHKCVPGSLFGAIPRAILHQSGENRKFQPNAAPFRAGRFMLAETINLLIKGAGELWGSDCAARLHYLGRILHELKAVGDEDLREHLKLVIDPLLTSWMQRLEKLLENSTGTDYWAHDVCQIRDGLVYALNQIDPLAPVDLVAAYGETEAASRFRDLIKRFADLLGAWPQLVASAKRKKEYNP